MTFSIVAGPAVLVLVPIHHFAWAAVILFFWLLTTVKRLRVTIISRWQRDVLIQIGKK